MPTLDASDEPQHGVEVSYTIADHYAVVVSAGHRYLVRILVPLGILGAIFVALGVALSGETMGEALASFPWELWGWLAGALGILNFGIVPLIAWFSLNRRQGGQPLTIAIQQDGVSVTSKNGAGLVYWSAIKRISATESRLLLFVGMASAIIVPARALPDNRTFHSMVELALAHWRQARK